MALHNVPQGEEDRHTRDASCPCSPAKTEGHTTVGTGRNRYPYQGVIFTHQLLAQGEPVTLPAGIARMAPPADPDSGPEAECGHVVVETESGEWQHHEIPGDDAPHAPTTECGCGPQRETVEGHIVIVHVDQAAGEADDDGEG